MNDLNRVRATVILHYTGGRWNLLLQKIQGPPESDKGPMHGADQTVRELVHRPLAY